MEEGRELVVKSFSKPDEVRTPPSARIEVVNLGQHKFSRLQAQPGWRWTKDMKPMAKTDTCQIPHTGVVISGSLGVDIGGKVTILTAGDAYEIPPGHDAWVEGDEPAVAIEVSPESSKWGKTKGK